MNKEMEVTLMVVGAVATGIYAYNRWNDIKAAFTLQ